MFRVLMVSYEFPPLGGGTAVACANVLNELARDGKTHIDVVTSGPGRAIAIDRPSPSVEIMRLPVGKKEPHFWRASELARWTWSALSVGRRLAAERDYDLCHCWAGWPSGLVGYRVRDRIPYVVGLRGSDVPGYNRRLRLLDPLVFRRVTRAVWGRAAAVIAVSEDLKALARRTSSTVPIAVIRNGVDATTFTPASSPPPVFTALFVGRLVERKGVGLLLRAFDDLVRGGSEGRLIVVGEGPELESLARRAGAAGAGRQVEFRGRVERAALPAVYREASVFVSPAFEDAMPNTVLEAMAAGLPVITTPTGAQELIRDNGILVARGSFEEIRDAMVRYRTSPELRDRHARRSRELAESMSWPAVAEEYRALYAEVVRASRIRAAHDGASGIRRTA